MIQLLDSIKMHGVFPSIKGSLLFIASWILNLWTDNGRNIILWFLTVIVTCYAIYDFHLKVQYKHRMDKREREREREEALRQASGDKKKKDNGDEE